MAHGNQIALIFSSRDSAELKLHSKNFFFDFSSFYFSPLSLIGLGNFLLIDFLFFEGLS